MKLIEWVKHRYFIWKMNKAVAIMKDRTYFPPEVRAVAQAMEATLNATIKSGNTGPVALMMHRRELLAFVTYIRKLHAVKVSHLQNVKYGATALMMKGRLNDDDIEKLKTGKRQIIVPASDRNARRIARKGQ